MGRMPESDKSAITPAFSVDRFGGTYSMTKVRLPWWHWRALLATLRHPRAAQRARREPTPDFVSYVGGRLATASIEEYDRVARQTKAIFAGPTALFFDTADVEAARAASDAAIFGVGYVGDGPASAFHHAGVAAAWLESLAASMPPPDPVGLTRDELLRRDYRHIAREMGAPLAVGFVERMLARFDAEAERNLSVDRSPFFTAAPASKVEEAVPIAAAHPAVRDEIAARLADQTVPCHACCGGPKKLGHEPGCEIGIRAMFASGRFDD